MALMLQRAREKLDAAKDVARCSADSPTICTDADGEVKGSMRHQGYGTLAVDYVTMNGLMSNETASLGVICESVVAAGDETHLPV